MQCYETEQNLSWCNQEDTEEKLIRETHSEEKSLHPRVSFWGLSLPPFRKKHRLLILLPCVTANGLDHMVNWLFGGI